MKSIFALLLAAVLLLSACDTNTAALDGTKLSTLSFEVGYTGEEIGEVNAVTPSTNAINKAMTPLSWAYAQLEDARLGELDIDFISQRELDSCFEYRVDDAIGAGDNYNPDVTDGLFPFFCRNNSNGTQTITASSTVDIRMVFGGETDERFDWHRFYVMTPETKDVCKDGGWQARPEGYKNQGQCIASVQANESSVH